MSRCVLCDHDLTASKDGKLFCTNARCPNHRSPLGNRSQVYVKAA